MTIPEVIIPYFNIAIILYALIRIIIGFKNGLIYQLYALFAVLVAAFIAWYFGPVLSASIQIYPEKFVPFAATEFGAAFRSSLNDACWYLILFLGVLLVSMLLKPFAKAIVELPVISTVNHILGAVFSLIPTYITMVLLAIMLSTPLFTNGKAVLEGCWLGKIQDSTTKVVSILKEPLETGEAIQKLINDQQDLTESDVTNLFNWLQEKGISSELIQEFLNEHTVFEVDEDLKEN